MEIDTCVFLKMKYFCRQYHETLRTEHDQAKKFYPKDLYEKNYSPVGISGSGNQRGISALAKICPPVVSLSIAAESSSTDTDKSANNHYDNELNTRKST